METRSTNYFFIFVIVCAFFHGTYSKWVEDTINGDSVWTFITRFCFISEKGKLWYHFSYPQDYAPQLLLFYYDTPGQWDSVYKRGLTCDEMVAVLNDRNQFELTQTHRMCDLDSNLRMYDCKGTMTFTSSRERWWYVAVSRCGQATSQQVTGLNLYYKMHMTNGDDLLHKEFSADEFYILLVDIIFFILYIKMMVLSIICAYKLIKRQLLHTTYKMYLAAITLWTLHLLCMVIAWGSYGTTGWEVRQVEVLGRLLQAISNIVFMLMLILIAKGYTIVRGRLTNKAILKITIFINLYIIATIVMFVWEGLIFDPGLVLYYYESPPGYGMIVIILIGWLWFTKAAIFTLKHFSSKTYFYIIFYSCYTVWFWASPVVTLIAMYAMAKWTREKSVNGVQQLIAYIGHLIFLGLTMPSKANDNFPFHIKTTQIGTMTSDVDETDDDALSGNRYSVSYMGSGPNLEIFVTSKSGPSRLDADGITMYQPLDPNLFQTNDSPPPGYQSAASDSEPITRDHSDRTTSNYNSNNNTSHASSTSGGGDSSVTAGPHSGQRLPPISHVLQDRTDENRETVLPPIRGSGLPPLLPTAPPSYGDMDANETAANPPPPDYSSLFQVSK